MPRSQEEIQEELDKVDADLRELEAMPPYFVVHGQVIDNRERISMLRKRKLALSAELEGKSAMQGPDLIV